MMNSKRSQVLVYGLIFGFFMALALYSLASYLKELPKTYLGMPPLELLKTASEAERHLFYVDMSANYAAKNSILELAQSSGFYSEPSCGKYLGYSLLNNKDKQITECFPDYSSSLKLIFNKNLGRYLAAHPDYKSYWSNYDISIEADDKLTILGKALYDLESGIGECSVKKNESREIVKLPSNSLCSLHSEYHNFEGGISWKVTEKGVEAEKKTIELNKDCPQSVLSKYKKEIEEASLKNNLPVPYIIATICAESNGNPAALRCEDSYEKTWQEKVNNLDCKKYGCDELIDYNEKEYHKVSCSYGLTQLMYPTALSYCKEMVTTPESIYDPAISISCASSYINEQAKKTGLDPPKVAAAYNAGSLIKACKGDESCSSNTNLCNDWCMRTYGIHIDKWLSYFNGVIGIGINLCDYKISEGIIISKEGVVCSLGKYFIRPSFKTKLDFDLKVFEKIKQEATELVEECASSDDKEKCVKKKIVEYNGKESKKENPVYWSLNCDKKESTDENNYIFCIDTNKKIDNEKVIIKFALNFGEFVSVERNMIFVPVNWKTDKPDFEQKAKASFDYFIEMSKEKGDRNTYKPIYQFSNTQITDYNNLTALVEQLESHVLSLGVLYDKNKDVVIAFTENSFGEDLGFVHYPYNQVVFANSNPPTPAHELGHSLFGYCEEYIYFDITCPDSIEHKSLIQDGIYDNLEAVTNLFYDFAIKDISDEESDEEITKTILELKNMDGYFNKYPDSEEGTDKMIENFVNAVSECELKGWLPQHYSHRYFFNNFREKYPRIFNTCNNPYPTCCADSPNYSKDTSKGINCYPVDYDVTSAKQKIITEIQTDLTLTEKEKQERIDEINSISREDFLETSLSCAGSSCGLNCINIMGSSDLEYPITSRKY